MIQQTAQDETDVVPPLTEFMINSRLSQLNWVSVCTNVSSLPSFEAPRGMFYSFARHTRTAGEPKLLFLNPAFQPHAPSAGGRLGFIVFGCSFWSMRFGGLHRLVVKRRMGRWSYYGDYRLLPLRTLSTSEWNALCVQVCILMVHFSQAKRLIQTSVSGQKDVGRVFVVIGI